MDRMTMDEVRKLALLEPKPRLTIYMPTNPGSPEARQDEIRLKNLADAAERQFVDAGIRQPVARDMLDQIRLLPTQTRFWHERRQGLVVLLAEDTCYICRFPIQFPDSVTVGPRFLLKPILFHLLSDHRFLLLALSRNQVRLYRGAREMFEQIPVPRMPKNIDEALRIDSADRGEQVRSIRRGDGGKDDAIFHGQGGKPETHKEDFARFAVEVQRALQPVLEQERDPLWLAGVDYELAMFSKVCTYPYLTESHLTGNADKKSEHDLHLKAWEHLNSQVDVQREQALGRYGQAVGNSTTSKELREIVVAAPRGDIDLLFVDQGRTSWGRFDPESETFEEHDPREPMDDELLDFVTIQTWLAKGTVLILPSEQMPEKTGVAAIYRRGRILQSAKQLEPASA
jgi:hypothetical protein